MTVIQRCLRCTLLGLLIVLTASLNLFCVFIDSDDGDPTTGVTLEFSAVQGKKTQVTNNLRNPHSNLTPKLFRRGFIHTLLVEKPVDVETASGSPNLTVLLASPLRC